MKELDNYEPFDEMSLQSMDWWEIQKIRRTLNILVKEVKELKDK